MSGEALGLIETIGLAAAVEAADAAVKSANVELVGYELTRGGGMVTIKILGNVGAVQAAVAAAAESARKVSKIWATHIIPRPHRETETLICTPETVGCNHHLSTSLCVEEALSNSSKQEVESKLETVVEAELGAVNLLPEEEKLSVKAEHAICNMCGDPACPRRKGDSRTGCIHYQTKMEEG
jgi:ethanolamine utilization protein EutM